jgi:hypothetical protein
VSKSEDNARSAHKLDKIWEDPVERFKCVRAEREARLDGWKKSMEEVIKSNADERSLLERSQILLQRRNQNHPETQKQLKLIEEKLTFLETRDELIATGDIPSDPTKISSKDLKKIIKSADIENKEAEIFKDIFDENEAKKCPFCGMTFNNLAGHLKTNDEEIQKMNSIPKRESEYQDNATNANDLMNNLQNNLDIKKLSEKTGLDLDISMFNFQSHHLILVAPYSFTMHTARMLNLIDFNINSEANCIALPSIDAKKFSGKNPKKSFGKQPGKGKESISTEQKDKITEAAMKAAGLQWHLGPHLFEPPGKDAYELQIVKALGKMEKQMMKLKLCGDNFTPEDRKKELGKLKDKLEKRIEKIKKDLDVSKGQKPGEREHILNEQAHKYATELDGKK